jgi:anaerobic magnesium-protoporphyrin IX monomethyl ester cyclase
MKRVLLLNPPYHVPIMRDTFHPTAKSTMYVWHPLDLLIQSGRLDGMDVRIHDGVVQNGMEPLRRLLDEFRPDGVLSLIAWPTLEADLALLKWIKDTYGPVVFAEGDITYGEKEAFLERHPFLDGILADFISSGFARYMRGDKVINAAWHENGTVVSDWTREPSDYSRPRHELLDLGKYYLPYWKPPFASVYTAHGCSSKCTFCPVPDLGPPRMRKLEAIVEELEFLRVAGVNKIFFRDASFNQAPRFMIALCEEIARRFPKLRFTTWFRPSPLTPEMAEAMRAAGCRYVHLGVETGSPEFLRRLGKDFHLEDVPSAVELLHRNRIRAVGHFMIGVPGETDDDWRMTLNYMKSTKLDVVSFSVYEQSFGAKLKYGESTAEMEKALRRKLLLAMSRFFFRPDRWPGFAGFVEGPAHFVQSLGRLCRYLFGLRLYPRIAALK